MKNRYTFLILASVALLGVFTMWWTSHRVRSAESGVNKGATVHVETSAKETNPGQRSVRTSTAAMSTSTTVSNDSIDMEKPPDVPQGRWDIGVSFFNFQKRSNGPIEFYGRIVDQYLNPVQHAKIRATLHVYPESFRLQLAKGSDYVEDKQVEMDSDASGLFSLSGGKARTLNFKSIENDGYLISGRQIKNYAFGLDYGNRHHADRNRPEIFSMWKKGVPEPLIKKEIQVDTKTDGRLYSVDLIKGLGFEGRKGVSDFTLRMSSDAKGGRTNWSVLFESNSNAFSVVEDAYLYFAPESGNTNSLYWAFNGSDPRQWTSRLKKKLYVVCRDGKIHAGINLEVYEYGNGKGRVILDALINPHGSQNLEYDKNLEIKGDALKKFIREFAKESSNEGK